MTYLAGQTLTADELNSWLPRIVTKPGDTSRASTTATSADPDLVVTIPAGQTWDINYDLYLSNSGGAGDFKCNLSWTNTATVNASIIGPGTGVNSNPNAPDVAVGPTIRGDTTSPSLDLVCGAFAGGSRANIKARVAAAAGADVVVTLNWAQSASDVNATTVHLGSQLQAVRVA